jgi:hypothetical protein
MTPIAENQLREETPVKKPTLLTIVLSLVLIALVACGPAGERQPTPDTQATVAAAVAATDTARAQMQATIDAAVQGTSAALPTPLPPGTAAPTPDIQATVDAAVQATMAAAPTPIPPETYVTMSEEEMAAAIDQSVTEATAATEQCSTAATEATADEAITAQEVEDLLVYLGYADEYIAYADELITAYDDLYGELATETLATLEITEQDLAALAETTAAIEQALLEINTELEQGLALATATIDQLNTAAQQAGTTAAQIQQQNQAWLQSLQAEMEALARNALAVQPNKVAADRQEALLSAFDYVDAVRQALGDNKLSQTELANIAQLGANATASLLAQGGPQLQALAGSFSDITGQLARGQVPQAQVNVGSLESALGTRPARPRP